MYRFRCLVSPFPRFETAFLFLWWGLIIFWIVDHLPDLRLAGAVCLLMAGILMVMSCRWNKRPISDKAFSCLQAEARFDAIREAWEAVCGEQRRPTWKEMQLIRKKIYAKVR